MVFLLSKQTGTRLGLSSSRKKGSQTDATTQHGVPARAAGLKYSILRAHVTRFQSRYVGIISMIIAPMVVFITHCIDMQSIE